MSTMVAEPRIALVPDLSMLSLSLHALLGERGGIPERLRLRLRTVLSGPSAQDAFGPIVRLSGARRQMPSAVAPLLPVADVAFEAQIAALRDNHSDLRKDLAALYPAQLPPAWRRAADNPARWSRAVADTLNDAWSAIGSQAWRQGRSLIDREFRRVGLAIARGAADGLINSLSPRICYDQDAVLIDRRVRVRLRGRRIVMAPMISAPGSIVVERDDPDAVVIGYALPRSLQAWHAEPVRTRSAHDPLSVVLGPVRATILRLLHRQLSMSQLATELRCAPSTVTHHCNGLESAGLIARLRDGKTVWISRTVRGAEMVDLLS